MRLWIWRLSILVMALLINVISFTVQAQEQQPSESDESQLWHADFVVIDKLTAKRTIVPIIIGQSAAFDKITIRTEKCWIQKTELLPEHAALVSIVQNSGKSSGAILYQGWLFSNKTDITNMQHPAYDVQLLGCKRSE